MQIKVLKKQKGLGDTVELALKLTGIHQIANLIANGDASKPCAPCMKRKENLNEAIPYGVRKNG